MRLYMLPYAGSGAMVYDKLKIKGIDCIPVEYSGHGFRYQEPLLCDEKSVVADVIKQIDTSEPYALFGHSMGGLIAWLTAKELEKTYDNSSCCRPKTVFISACEPPDVLNVARYVEFSQKDRLISFIQQYNRLSEQRINTKVFNEIIIPIMQNDYRFLAKYTCQKITQISIPLVVIFSKEDTLMRYVKMDGWAKFGEKIGYIQVEGEHFYIETNREEIIGVISKELINN